MEKEGIELREHSVQEINLFEDTEELGMKFGIRNVPTIVVLNEREQEVGRARNIEQLKEILK